MNTTKNAAPNARESQSGPIAAALAPTTSRSASQTRLLGALTVTLLMTAKLRIAV